MSGFVHQFFYGYRYFVSPTGLMRFICDKFSTALLDPTLDVGRKVATRSLDLMCTWIDGYYNVDFQNSTKMLNMLESFVKDKVCGLKNIYNIKQSQVNKLLFIISRLYSKRFVLVTKY